MEKIPIKSEKAPKPIGPYIHGVLESYNHRLHISGQSGRNPQTGELEEGIESQTSKTLDNVKTVLSEVGWNLNNVIRMRIFLTDMGDYSKVNEVYEKIFGEDLPARTVVAVSALPGGALIEIECVAGGNTIKGAQHL